MVLSVFSCLIFTTALYDRDFYCLYVTEEEMVFSRG